MAVEVHEKTLGNTTELFADLVGQLTTDQMRFVVARQEHASDREAATAIGISPETVKNWKRGGNKLIDDSVRLIAMDGIIVATEMRRRNLAKAMGVKVKGLDSDSEQIRQKVSTEIIEWEMGKATQSVDADITSAGEKILGPLICLPPVLETPEDDGE